MLVLIYGPLYGFNILFSVHISVFIYLIHCFQPSIMLVLFTNGMGRLEMSLYVSKWLPYADTLWVWISPVNTITGTKWTLWSCSVVRQRRRRLCVGLEYLLCSRRSHTVVITLYCGLIAIKKERTYVLR